MVVREQRMRHEQQTLLGAIKSPNPNKPSYRHTPLQSQDNTVGWMEIPGFRSGFNLPPTPPPQGGGKNGRGQKILKFGVGIICEMNCTKF